ncbi:MAG: L-2-amino-thiazoline-4-carboxylic acid hydrolase [Hyphomicrobiales bacterium]|nr:L-2-amino-thiazoline-4-carboxylic acid hydrolase [Hyphomicrobiales bacterium]MCP5373277.1 L-2-amino-thiazoline-4-carboxylic acid hydrolase [Hyphomicrobiales bacterium]
MADDAAKLTPFQHIALTVQAQVPLVRAMEAELGVERAHALVRRALDDRNRAQTQARAQENPVDIPTLAAEFASYGEGVTYEFEVREQTATTFHVDVTACGYAQFMDDIGARDLGPLLICDCDFALAEGLGLELTRTRTCMQGDGVCDFRFKLAE